MEKTKEISRTMNEENGNKTELVHLYISTSLHASTLWVKSQLNDEQTKHKKSNICPSLVAGAQITY